MPDLIPLEEFVQPETSNLVPLEEFGGEVKGIKLTGTTGRSFKNNNPLNLEYRPGSYQDKHGAVPEPTHNGRFAKFPTMAAGYHAGLDQIRLDQSAERSHTLSSFVHKFAPPHENPTEQIVNQYAKALGVNPNTPLSQIPPEKLIVPMLARESSTRVVRDKGLVEKAVDVIGPKSAEAAEEGLIPLERFVQEPAKAELIPLEEFNAPVVAPTEKREATPSDLITGAPIEKGADGKAYVVEKPTFAPTKEQAEAAAKASGVEVETWVGTTHFPRSSKHSRRTSSNRANSSR